MDDSAGPVSPSTTQEKKPGFESTLGALVAHPTRVKSFVMLTERVASPREIASELGLEVSHVGYHVRKLKSFGLVELVAERPVRGAVEHFYRAVKRPYATTEDLDAMSPEHREALTRYILQLHFADAARAMDAGTFDARSNRYLIRVPLQIDEKGFAELGEAHARLYEEVLEVQAKSAARISGDPDTEAIPTVSTAMFFETPVRDRKSRFG